MRPRKMRGTEITVSSLLTFGGTRVVPSWVQIKLRAEGSGETWQELDRWTRLDEVRVLREKRE
jgi:hypothetical protein